MKDDTLTIGELARQIGLRTSTLRYYEKEGLLEPSGRTEAGYRLYEPVAVDTVRLIRRAQRLGFSLAEIRTLLAAWQAGTLDDAQVLATAEARYLALERQVTELRVQQHELELFLQDLQSESGVANGAQDAFDRLVDHICANPTAEPPSRSVLDWLATYSRCALTGDAAEAALERLRGQHAHIWQEGDAYHILVVSREPAVAAAMRELGQIEADCNVHAQLEPDLVTDDEGYRLVVGGDNAFLLARLFLALEYEKT